MKMMKHSVKEDRSARVTSPGAEKKNYQGSSAKMVTIRGKKWKGGNAMLGKGNSAKPDGNLPNMGVKPSSDPSPRNNPYHGGGGSSKMPAGKVSYSAKAKKDMSGHNRAYTTPTLTSTTKKRY